jgi:plastocyanin
METSLACQVNHAPRRRAAIVLGITLAIFGFSRPGHAAGPIIQASNYEYVAPGGGSSLTVAAGTEVTWIASGDPHTVTSGAPGAVDNRFVDHPASVGLLLSGSSFASVFTTPGTYPYFCEIHPEQMSGVVNVIAAATPEPTPAPTPRQTAPPTASPLPTPSPAASPSPAATSTTAPSQIASAAPAEPPPLSSFSAAPSDVQIGGSAIPSQSASPSIEPTSRDGIGESGAGPLAIAALLAVLAAAGLASAIVWRRRRRP